jgi:DNA-binding MarR family transcriptional regulator
MPLHDMILRSPARVFRELARIHVRAQRAAVGCHGGSVTQCTILTELGRAKSLSLAGLAARLRLDKGWVSRAIDELVTAGTVRRAADPDDGRAVVLTLTANGRTRYRDLERTLDAQITDVFARLRATDRAKVASALKLLFAAYSDAIIGEDAAAAGRATRVV